MIGGSPEPEARGTGDVGGAARPVGGDDAGGSPGGACAGPALFDDGDAPARFAEFSRREEAHDAATDDNDVAHEMPFYVAGRLDVLPMGLYHGGSTFPQAGESRISGQKNDGPGEPSFRVFSLQGLFFGVPPLCDVGRLKPFRALDNFEVHVLSFLQGFESLSLDGGEVNENVVTIRLRNESIALRVIEPLHCSFWHLLISCMFWKWVEVKRVGAFHSKYISGNSVGRAGRSLNNCLSD